MKRLVFETGLVIAVLVFALEAIHYRQAVLEANVDRKRAWKTVVELRRACPPDDSKGTPSAGN